MASDSIDISIRSTADLKGVSQMAKAVRDLSAQIKGVGTIPKTSDPFKGLSTDAIKAEKAVIGLAQAQAKLSGEQAKAATSAQKHATEIQRTAQAEQRYAASVAQAAAAQARAEVAGIRLVQAKERVAKSADSGTSALSKFGGKALEIAGGIGIATSAAELLAAAGGRVKEGFNLAKSIEQTTATLAILTGSQERANLAFEQGEAFADRYKFKISEINTALGSLGPLMNTSAVSTEKQLEVLARLQTLGVGKTFAEAAFSAKELASGDYVSIVEQFNLSKTAAAGLRDEIAAGADVFEVLDRYLTSVNVSTGVLETRTQGAAGAANNYAKAQEDLNLALGKLAQGPGVTVLNFFAELANNLATVATAGQKVEEFAQQAFTDTSSYDAYTAKITMINGELGKVGMSITPLTKAQYENAQAMIAQGEAADKAYVAVAAYDDTAQTLATSTRQLAKFDAERAAALESLTPKILKAASASEQDRVNVLGLVEAYNDGFLSADQLSAALDTLGVAQQHAANGAALVEQRHGEMRPAIEGATEAAKLGTDEMMKLYDELIKISGAGAQAVGALTESETGFLADRESARAEHEARITSLTEEAAAATTEVARTSVQERIAAEQEGYAQQEQIAAEAYARQAGQQRQALGEQLIAYVDNQAALNKISEEKAGELREGIAKEYGVVQHQTDLTFSAMKQSVDNYASGVTDNAGVVINSISAQQSAAETLKAKYDSLVAKYTAEIVADIDQAKGPTQEQLDLLARIPARVYSEVYVTTTNTTVNRTVNADAPRSQQRYSGEVDTRAAGGPVNVGRTTLVGEEGPELVVFGGPATVIPADQTRRLRANGMARGGNVMGGTGGGSVTAQGAGAGGAQVEQGSITLNVGIQRTGLTIQAMGSYVRQVEALSQFIEAVETINQNIRTPQAPLDPASVEQLARDTATVARVFAKNVVGGAELQANQMKGYLEISGIIVDAAKNIVDLKQQMVEPSVVITQDMAQRIASEVAAVARAFGAVVVPSSKSLTESVKQFGENVGAAVSTLTSILDLKRGLQERAMYPVDPRLVGYLATAARDVATVVARELAPAAAAGSEELTRTIQSVTGSVDAIMAILDLKKGLKERELYPVDPTLIKWLAQAARDVAIIVRRELAPAASDGGEALQATVDQVLAGVDAVQAMIDLKKSLSERVMYPIVPEVIKELAQDAQRVNAIVQGEMLPTSEEQAKALALWADSVGSSVGILKDVTSLGAEMFTDYVSPSDADLNRIAADADRVARRLTDIARTYDTKGLESAKLFADAVGGTFGAFKDGLLFFDALKSGDFTLDRSALASFETSTAATLETMNRLGTLAAAIPPANIAALSGATAALSGQAEALIRLSAVPWGNMPQTTAGYAGQASGGGTTITFAPGAVVINNPGPGFDSYRAGQQFGDGMREKLLGRRT